MFQRQNVGAFYPLWWPHNYFKTLLQKQSDSPAMYWEQPTASEGADPRDLHGSQSQDSRASDQSKHKFSKRTKTLWFAHVPLWFTFLFVLLTQERRGMPGGRMGPWTSGVGHSPNNTFNSLCVLVIYCLACTFLDLKHKPSLDFTTYFFIMGSMSHLCFL